MRSLRLVAILAIPAQLVAQQTPMVGNGTPLSLEQAISLAQQNNPQYLQTKNLLRNAEASVRSAYGSLLPQSSLSYGTNYTQGGTQYVQGVALPANPDVYQSRYFVGLSYSISAAAAYVPRAAKANRAAAEADITNSAEMLRSTITQDYITALQNEAQAAVADTLVETAQGQLQLVNAKLEVGAGTIIDVRAAEVALGQAQVNALTAHNTARVTKVRLFQDMGVAPDPDAKLTSTFTVAQPTFTLDSLLAIARRSNPDLAARHSREYAAQQQIRVSQSSYLPFISLSTGYGANASGYADAEALADQSVASVASSYRGCLSSDSLRVGAGLAARGCGTGTLSPSQLYAIRASNKPWSFNKAPYGVSAQLSLPIFNGFQREAQVEQARVAHDNAIYDVKARNLQLTTDVTQQYLNLLTAVQTVKLQQQIAAKAAEDLALSEASFKVGAKTFLDVTSARGLYEQAQIAQVNAIYDYHRVFAALESAVGRPLR
ncbi:MAG: TolC family protein [Gemmatimonadaceae bacterium]